MRPLLLCGTFAASTLAIDLTRICQANDDLAPRLVNCQNYKDAINKRYAGGVVFQTDSASSCETVYELDTCRIAICAFPGQSISNRDLITGIDDILNNCQKVASFAGQTRTGGYNIVKGTNITLGVFASDFENPYAAYRVATDSASPVAQDCYNYLNTVDKAKIFTQDDPSGCTIVGSSGTCSVSYCDTPGLQITGRDLYNFGALLPFAAGFGNKAGGFYDLRQDLGASFVKRIGLFKNAKPAAVTSDQVFCVNSTNTATLGDCRGAAGKIGQTSGVLITQDQKNTDCKRISIQGSCQLNLCAPTGTQLKTSVISAAVKTVNDNCGGGTDSSVTGGYIRIAGTDATLSLAGLPAKTILWVNGAANNSPKRSDATAILNNINGNTVFRTGNTNSPQGCTQLAASGTAKVNLCGPPGTVISGADLRYTLGNILSENAAYGYNQFSSGVSIVSPRANVTLYETA